MKVLADTKNMLDSDIQAIRAEKLGSSEIAWAALGNECEVVLDKTGLVKKEITNLLKVGVGLELEQFNAEHCGQVLAERYPGAIIEIEKVDKIFEHEALSYRTSSPDFWVTISHDLFPFSGERGLMETKTTAGMNLSQWEDGPADYADWQMRDQLFVLDEPKFAIGSALIFTQQYDHRWHCIERDPEVENYIEELSKKLHNYIDRKIIPEDSDLSMMQVKALYPRVEIPTVELASVLLETIEQYEAQKEQEKAAKKAVDALQARLCAQLGGAERGMCGDRVITWKEVSAKRFDSTTFKKAHPELVEHFTKESTFRRFNISKAK